MATWSTLSRAERRLNALVIAGVLLPLGLSAYALSVSFVFRPDAIGRGEHLSLLGVSLPPCPGCSLCGMSRAFSAFAHADIAGAVAYHPGVLVTFPLFWALAAVCLFGLYRFARMPISGIRLSEPSLNMASARRNLARGCPPRPARRDSHGYRGEIGRCS